jgi:hypothetical protein
MSLPEIPKTYILTILMIGLVIIRCFGIDSWTTAMLSIIVGYITGKHVEQTRGKK